MSGTVLWATVLGGGLARKRFLLDLERPPVAADATLF